MSIWHSPLAVWELTSAGMLTWLAAAALPWLVHRLLQRPQVATDWAAVDLLLEALRSRSRQLNLHQWLLLAIRTAIVSLVVLAAAGPVYRQLAIGAGSEQRSHRVLVLDCSGSMAVEEKGGSRLQRAKNALRDIVADPAASDVFSLIAWDSTARDLLGRPLLDRELVVSAAETLEPADGRASLSAALDAIEAAIEKAKKLYPDLSHHEVFFFSDRTRSSWEVASSTQERISKLANVARLHLVDVDDGRRDNVAVVGLSVDSGRVLEYRLTEVIAQVQSLGSVEGPPIDVELVVDGRQVGQQQTELSSGEVQEIRFPYRFLEAGVHAVEVSVSAPADALQADNRCFMAVRVRPHLRVACVAGYPQAADEVSLALSPSRDNEDDGYGVQAEVIPLSRLSRLQLEDYDAVMLCSIEQLSSREATLLANYVRRGGGLAVLLRSSTPGSELASLLPMDVAPESINGDFRFDPLNYSHPIVAPFSGRSSAGLLNVSINRYAKLTARESDSTLKVALGFNSGDPALICNSWGQGRVAVLALPAALQAGDSTSKPWSSFPVSPSFLPITRELVGYLVGDNWIDHHNFQVGESGVVRVEHTRRNQPPSVSLPDGKQVQATIEEGRLILPVSKRTGFYTLQQDGRETTLAATNFDACESDLSIAAGDLLPANLAVTEKLSVDSASHQFGGRSLAGSLLAGALMLMMVESTLAWLLGRSWA